MASIIQMTYALALEREQNFQKAAKSCFITQPTLSMQLQKLEEEYEVILFDRTRKPVIPTEIGLEVLGQFRRVIREFEKISETVSNAKHEIKGNYSLGVIPTMAPWVVPKLIKEFSALYPMIELTLKEITTEQIIQELKLGRLDAGILATPLRDPVINETHIANEFFKIYHSKSLSIPTNKNLSIDVQNLPLDKLILLSEGNCLRVQALDLCRLQKIADSKIRFQIEAGSLATLVNIVSEGEYFTIIPELATAELSKKQQADQVKNFHGFRPYREIGVVTHRNLVKQATNNALIEILKELLKSRLINQQGAKSRLIEPLAGK